LSRRLPPLTRGFYFDDWLRASSVSSTDFAAALATRLGASQVSFHGSGREALRVLFSRVADGDRHAEVALPAYTCFSVASAAVAAGLRVRLIDVDREGRLAMRSFADTPMDKVRALVVCNLFGLAEPVAPIRDALSGSGICLVDDAAQSLGASDGQAEVGSRGDVGVLSFARGKPLSGLGGGALCWSSRGPAIPAPRSLPKLLPHRALLRGVAYEFARHPRVFPWLCRLPGLGIGETHFDAEFPRGDIDGSALLLAALNFQRFDDDASRRRQRARLLGEEIRKSTGFRPLLDDAERLGVFPRLAVVAPDSALRDAALAELAPLGASPLYPSSLSRVSELRRYLVGELRTPGADELAGRLLTLPVHERVGQEDRERMLEVLRKSSPRA